MDSALAAWAASPMVKFTYFSARALRLVPLAMAIAKGTKRKALAEKYVNFTIGEAAQAANAESIFLAPVNKKVQLTSEAAQFVPYGDVLKRLFVIDWDEFTKHREQWVDRWNREIK